MSRISLRPVRQGLRTACVAVAAAAVTTTGISVAPAAQAAETTQLYRAVNLTGSATTIAGEAWEAGKGAANLVTSGRTETWSKTLRPATDSGTAAMLRTSLEASSETKATMTSVPAGTYDVVLFLMEDAYSKKYDVRVEGDLVKDDHVSGSAGTWHRLGPFRTTVADGTIATSVSGRSPNLAGLHVTRVHPVTTGTTDATETTDTATTTAPTFPTAATTGVPAGTVLKPSGSITVTQAGAVIDAREVTGTISVQADNVTIKRTRILNTSYYPIRLHSGYKNLLVEDVEINGQGKASAAVAFSNYTLRRVNIHNVNEGPRLGSNTTVENSYIHHLAQCDGCHNDVLQSTGGSNITIRGNNLQAWNPKLGKHFNAAFQYGEEKSTIRDCRVEGNLMNGGNYTVNGGGGGTTGAACSFSGNRFQRDFRYKPAGNLGSNTVWDSSNVWHDTGLPVS